MTEQKKTKLENAGAGWDNTTTGGREYISFQIDLDALEKVATHKNGKKIAYASAWVNSNPKSDKSPNYSLTVNVSETGNVPDDEEVAF